MKIDSYIPIYSIGAPILFGLMAAFFFVIGLRGILNKRPFCVSNRWILSMIFVIFLPNILPAFFLPFSSFLIKWLNPVMFTVLLVMMCFVLKGYSAYAVTDTSFREALLAALEKLQLPYAESLSVLRLTSVEVDLQVSVQSWAGAGQFNIRQRGHRSLLREIATAMNEHFRTSSVRTNLMPCVFYVVMGVLMSIAGIGMLLLFQNI